MKDKSIVEAMAEIDGIHSATWIDADPSDKYPPYEVQGHERDGKRVYKIPAYLTSHDAVQRVVDGLSFGLATHEDNELSLYDHYLGIVFGSVWRIDRYRATPRQKCEAILKALGKWESDS